MKTLIKSFIIAGAITFSSVSFTQVSHAASPNLTELESIKFLRVEPLANGKIDITIRKVANTRVSILVKDQLGKNLANQTIDKNDLATKSTFDLSSLPDGTYLIVVEDGKNHQVKEVVLNTRISETSRTISVV